MAKTYCPTWHKNMEYGGDMIEPIHTDINQFVGISDIKMRRWLTYDAWMLKYCNQGRPNWPPGPLI
jgi:hypothetical protein